MSQNQPEKTIAETCSDTAIVVMAHFAEGDKELADYLIKQLISLIRSFERRPFSKPEPIFLAFYHCLKLSPKLVQSAKDHELAGKLIGLISTLYDLGAVEPK